MTIRDRFNFDYAALNAYINKMLKLRISDLFEFDYIDEDYSKNTFSCSYLIKPGLVIEMYGLIDFYLQKIISKLDNRFDKSYSDFKEKNKKNCKASELYKQCHYISKSIDLKILNTTLFKKIDELRIIRNCFTHRGSHIQINNKLKNIQYLNLSVLSKTSKTALISLNDDFFLTYMKYIKEFFDMILAKHENDFI